MNFDEIIGAIGLREFKEILLYGQYEQLKNWYPSEKINTWMRGIEKEISVGAFQKKANMDTLKNISYFARAISQMHPGWEKWDKDPDLKKDKDHFKQSIENLYNQQFSMDETKRLKGDNLLAELYKIAGALKDNHLEVFATKQKSNGDIHYYQPIDQKTKLKYRPESKGTVGKNLAFSPDFRKEDRHTRVFNLQTGPLVIAERIINGKKTGVIGLSTCMIQQGTPNEGSQRHAFSEIIKTLKNNMENWDNIILDVRGNGGGVPDYLRQIAKTICDSKEELPSCVEAQARKTEEATLRNQFYYTPYTQEKRTPKQYRGKQSVFVLTDKETGSAAEFVYPLFKQYEGTQFIGESTKGCCQYGEVNRIALPCGGALQMGNVFYDFDDGFIEGKGHKPDINCSGHDALQEAIARISNGSNKIQKDNSFSMNDLLKHLQNSEREIDEALIHLPFEIQAKSLQEKISAYERIKLLLDTKVGQELLVEAKKIAEKHGKIILKEDKTDGYGYVDVKNPRTIVLSSRFGKSIERTNNPKQISSIKHLATSTLAHEMRHVIQHYHPDGNVCLSLEDGAKKNLMQELGARMTNVLYESSVGLDSPRALLFQSFKQTCLDSGMDDEKSERTARTQMARLYLTGGKDYKGKDSELKEEFSDWKKFLINQSLRYTARRQFSTGNNLRQRQSNHMNYLCDSMGLDRDILKTTDQIYDNHRCVCKNGALETIQLGNVICERFQKDGQTIIHETEQSDKSEIKCIMIDGKMRQWEKYTTNGSYVIQYNHLGQEVSNQNYPAKDEKFDRQGYLKKTKMDLQTNTPKKDNPFSMNDLLKHLQSMVLDVQSLRSQVAQIRTQNAPQKINNILATQSQAGKEQILQNNLANNLTRLSAPER